MTSTTHHHATHPRFYPIEGGYPYLNLSRAHGVLYEWVLNRDMRLPADTLREIALIEAAEEARKAGGLGPLNGRT